MNRTRVLTVVMLLAFCLAVPIQAVLAAVIVTRFEAKAQPDNTILVEWETATEPNIVGFRLYRAESASPDDWGAAIDAQGAKGDQVTGAIYQYVDSNVTAGIRYYYLLEDISSTNEVTPHGPVSAGIDLPPTPLFVPFVAR